VHSQVDAYSGLVAEPDQHPKETVIVAPLRAVWNLAGSRRHALRALTRHRIDPSLLSMPRHNDTTCHQGRTVLAAPVMALPAQRCVVAAAVIATAAHRRSTSSGLTHTPGVERRLSENSTKEVLRR